MFLFICTDQIDKIGQFVSHMVERGPLGRVLDKAYEGAGKDEVVDLYLQDFVRMVYLANDEQPDVEYQVNSSFSSFTRLYIIFFT